jgi:hypothetical protein
MRTPRHRLCACEIAVAWIFPTLAPAPDRLGATKVLLRPRRALRRLGRALRRFKDKVIEVHSAQRGDESDEAMQRLVALEMTGARRSSFTSTS